ncbi:MAG: SAP domain-containing protein [Chloroflexota bacterium]|nr:SAP domain-containing protein [Chloroflexota bacterium]
MGKLRPSMSVEEFEDGYFYAAELKAFARQLGIAVGRRRKPELEALIREFLRTGTVPPANPEPDRRSGKSRDRLAPETIVRDYVDNRRTKDFLRDLVHARVPQLKDKSGQWYRLNEWRRSQLRAGQSFTYADLANRLLELMRWEGPFPRIPAGRFNNFVTDFFADPGNKGKTRAEAVAAWEHIKSLPGPKTYQAYAALKAGRT